jgi:hypothetical protein
MFRVHFETQVRPSVRPDTREPAAVMSSYFVKLALLASFPLLVLSCNVTQSGPVSVGKAISNASATTGVHRVDRSAAKLMQWKEFQSGSGWAPGACCFSTPGDSQLVWVVALAGDIRLADDAALQQRSEIVVLNAYSGDVIAFDSGIPVQPWPSRQPWPNDWPPYWDQLPDRSHT